jgi:membrane-bound metal-dependent hydrolase YbcI (DUF457 family)
MLHTIRVGADGWRRYTVGFDAEAGEVVVSMGPLVSTAQRALPGSEPRSTTEARAAIGVPFGSTDTALVTVDAFTGPTLTFVPERGRVDVRFLDWHRRWTHSLAFAAVVGLLVGIAGGVVETLIRGRPVRIAWTAALVATLGVVGHIAVDQMGSMGSNLLCPFTRRRTRGLGWIHSGDSIPNFLSVWVSAAAALVNLDRFASRQRLDLLWFIGLAVGLPTAVLGVLYWRQRVRGDTGPAHARASEVQAEMSDADLA